MLYVAALCTIHAAPLCHHTRMQQVVLALVIRVNTACLLIPQTEALINLAPLCTVQGLMQDYQLLVL